MASPRTGSSPSIVTSAAGSGGLGPGSPGQGNVPLSLTPLVGREDELRQLDGLLAGSRLVTIVGTGGCGKSRLALALADRLADRYRDGIWWVDLSATSGREVPVQAVVRSALGLPQSAGDSAVTLAQHLRGQQVLVMLDNCEHVANECAVLIELLLRTAPDLAVLATSREVIGASGEQVFRLDGLQLADGRGVETSEAAQLFLARATAVVPGFELAAGDAEPLGRLCSQLDGLPLTIELAAARVGMLSITEIARRLEHDVGLLRHPSRTAPARQQTLVATLDWSHGLLDGAEQVLFRRLACFRGSFSLLAAETITSEGGLVLSDVLHLLGALVDKSLVQVADRGVEHRYRLLETVRQYAEQRLAASDDESAVRAAHAEFYLELALRARAGLDGPDQVRWLDRLDIENGNVRAALEWALQHRPETGCRLAAALWPFWYRRGHYNEGRYWLEEALTVAGAASPAAQAATLAGAGILAFFQCDYEIARQRLSIARSLYEAEGDGVGLATVLQRLGSIAREEARYAEARRLHEAARVVLQELGDEVGSATCEDHLGFAAWLEGDFVRAIDLCAGAVETFRRHGRRQETAAALVNLGAASLLAGDTTGAERQLRESLELSEELGYPEGVAWSSHELALVLADREEAAARELLARSLRGHVELGDRWRVASVLETVAGLEAGRRVPELSAELIGAARALREQLGAPIPPSERPRSDEALRRLRRELGDVRLEELLTLGGRLALAGAVELAAAALELGERHHGLADAPAQDAPKSEHGLTERELDVLRLLAQGLTNRQIGGELHISAGTAGVHVSNILRKLGVSGRVQAAGVAHQLGLDS